MKKPLRHFLLNVVSIALLSHALSGVSYNQDLKTLLLASLIMGVLNLFIRPILKIIFLPINVITFGLAGWVISVIILYLTTLLVDGFSITTFDIGPLSLLGFSIPKIIFSGFWAYFMASFILGAITSFIYWVL